MSSSTQEAPTLSVECELAKRPDYKDVHNSCRQTKDIPLPHGSGILLQRRCGCTCHRGMAGTP